MKDFFKSLWSWFKKFGKNFIDLFVEKATTKVTDILTNTDLMTWGINEVAELWKRDDLTSAQKRQKFVDDAKAKFPQYTLSSFFNLFCELCYSAYEATNSETTTTEA